MRPRSETNQNVDRQLIRAQIEHYTSREEGSLIVRSTNGAGLGLFCWTAQLEVGQQLIGYHGQVFSKADFETK